MSRKDSEREKEASGKKPPTPGVSDGFSFANVAGRASPDPALDLGLQNIPVDADESTPRAANKYYTYHPKSGSKGGNLGAPRKKEHMTQISIGCTEEEKRIYKAAAKADKRKLSDFISEAVMFYIDSRGLSDKI